MVDTKGFENFVDPLLIITVTLELIKLQYEVMDGVIL